MLTFTASLFTFDGINSSTTFVTGVGSLHPDFYASGARRLGIGLITSASVSEQLSSLRRVCVRCGGGSRGPGSACNPGSLGPIPNKNRLTFFCLGCSTGCRGPGLTADPRSPPIFGLLGHEGNHGSFGYHPDPRANLNSLKQEGRKGRYQGPMIQGSQSLTSLQTHTCTHTHTHTHTHQENSSNFCTTCNLSPS